MVAASLVLSVGAVCAASGPDLFVVHTVKGDNATGPVQKLAPDGTVRVGGSRPALIPVTDVVTVRRAGLRLPAFPERALVVLTHGDRIPFADDRPLKLEEGRLYFHLRPEVRDDPLRIPRAFVALLWLAPADGTRLPDLAVNRLVHAKRTRDVLYLRNGDQLAGALAAIDPVKGARMEAGGRAVTIALSQVSAIAFNTELQARIRPPKVYTHVVLANGGRLSFNALQLAVGAAKLEGKTLFGTRLEVPLGEVAAWEPRSAGVIHLSDMKPARFEHTPFFNVSWPLMTDAAVSGAALRVGGSTFDKGLGMHSKSAVTYALDGRFRWFEAVVGLDDRAGRRAQARLQVLVDGKEHSTSPEKVLHVNDPPLTLRINIAGARELTLLADFGSYGDVQAHVNWADARLIR